jgi:hypothetical protein
MSEQQAETRREVRIHIDQHKYESPNPTTGAALYILGKVAAGLDLYREVSGNKEDQPIENGSQVVHLHEDEHFHSGPPRTYTIYVNGQKKVVTTKTMTFDAVVKLAYPTPPTGQNIMYTVSYEDGPPSNPQGALLEGETVKIKDGMIFNVTPTDKS